MFEFRAVYNGYTTVRCREAEVVVCGGQENMSRAEYTTHVRGSKLGNTEFKDTILCDGLTCAFENVHMGETGEIYPLHNFYKTWNCYSTKTFWFFVYSS